MADSHRFCGGCGQSLVGVTSAAGPAPDRDDDAEGDETQPMTKPIPRPDSTADEVEGGPHDTSESGSSPRETDDADATGQTAVTAGTIGTAGAADAADVVTGRQDLVPDQDAVVTDQHQVVTDPHPAVASPTAGPAAAAADAEPTLPNLGELPTRPIKIGTPLPDPTWATGSSVAVDDRTTDTGRVSVDDTFGRTTGVTVVQPEPKPRVADVAPVTGPVPLQPAPVHTDQLAVVAPAPPLFDGEHDVRELPPGRDPFTFKLLFVFAFFAAVATVMAAAATVVDLRTSIPVDGISTGPRVIDELGTNLALAGFVGAFVMVVGGLLACFGFRWGAGLAGGAGLALVGWAAITIGLTEAPIAAAEATTRASPIPFTLKVTRDLGYWLVVASAGLGLLGFVSSLRSIRTGGHPPHNPWVAAVGAVAGVVLCAGPLLPVGNAEFSDNFRSPDALVDVPTAYFAGRLVQLGLIALCVVLGLLIVRAYGLGLAAGGVSVAFWLWLSSLLQLQDDTAPGPVGIGIGNFGATDTTPHAVTTVGMVLTLAMLLISGVLATAGHFRHRRRAR